jgi:hypothetical protein
MQAAIATLTQTVSDLALRLRGSSTAADLLVPQLETLPSHSQKQQPGNKKQQRDKAKSKKPQKRQQVIIQKQQQEKPQKHGKAHPKGVTKEKRQVNVNRRHQMGDHLRNKTLQLSLDVSDQMEVDHSSDSHDLDQDDPKEDDVQEPVDDAYANPYATMMQTLFHQSGMPTFPLSGWQLPPSIPTNASNQEMKMPIDTPMLRRSSRTNTGGGQRQGMGK